MQRKFVMLLALSCILAASVFAQGLTTQASKDDWEEINFEYNSAVLSDGYPSLLRLADLLRKNPGYHVKVEGNSDNIGSDRANEKLALARANTVRDFLVKYGAGAGQIDVATKGKRDPKYPGFKPGYSATDVARWMNRRVVLTVTDQNGKTIGDGGINTVIESIKPPAPSGPNCCDDILKRLDAITALLKDMQGQNASLKKEVDDLKNRQAAADNKMDNAPKPLTKEETAQVVDARLDKARDPRFSLLGFNIGADDKRDLTFTGSARFFAPFKSHFAIQAQGEYMYFRSQKEGQADIGLVNRFGNIQAGIFGSFKTVSLNGATSAGTVGQGSMVIEYLFSRGKVGLFGTKGFLNNAVIDHRNATFSDANGNLVVAPNLFTERYLRVVDQLGAQATYAMWGNNYVEGNWEWLKTSTGSRAGANAKLVFPFNKRLALTVEGGMNPTLVGRDNSGRAVVGLEFGNFIHPKDFVAADHPVPMQIPRVKYEVLTRTKQVGVSQPIADAGPDQIGVAAGSITLNGSGSRDPNGEALTFQWVQETGPAVALSAANAAVTTFTSVAGQAYTFRLTVKNTDNQQAAARVRVTTSANPVVEIVLFNANPSSIQAGSSSVLTWKVLNADTVTIQPGIGSVNASNGTVSVSPAATTTYTLTATNKSGSVNATQVVTVTPRPGPVPPAFGYCNAVPATITRGEAATIYYQTSNATGVTVAPGGGSFGQTGNFVVTPTDTTNYTITAQGLAGAVPATATCSVSVKVTPLGSPRIVKFSANPMTINMGATSTLLWVVEGAKTVTIDQGVGQVDVSGGARDVQPQTTTTYTLTATSPDPTVAPVTQTATVTVIGIPPKPAITSFTATPPTIDFNNPGPYTSTLNCKASNASRVVISGLGPVDASGNFVVSPTVTTTYVCVANGANPADQASANVTVTVIPARATPPAPNASCIVTPNFDTPNSGTTVCETVVRNNDIAYVPTGNPAPVAPLTFNTVSRNVASAVLNSTGQTVSVELSQLFGDYFFDYTATDSKGRTTTGTVDLRYVISHLPR